MSIVPADGTDSNTLTEHFPPTTIDDTETTVNTEQDTPQPPRPRLNAGCQNTLHLILNMGEPGRPGYNELTVQQIDLARKANVSARTIREHGHRLVDHGVLRYAKAGQNRMYYGLPDERLSDIPNLPEAVTIIDAGRQPPATTVGAVSPCCACACICPCHCHHKHATGAGAAPASPTSAAAEKTPVAVAQASAAAIADAAVESDPAEATEPAADGQPPVCPKHKMGMESKLEAVVAAGGPGTLFCPWDEGDSTYCSWLYTPQDGLIFKPGAGKLRVTEIVSAIKHRRISAARQPVEPAEPPPDIAGPTRRGEDGRLVATDDAPTANPYRRSIGNVKRDYIPEDTRSTAEKKADLIAQRDARHRAAAEAQALAEAQAAARLERGAKHLAEHQQANRRSAPAAPERTTTAEDAPYPHDTDRAPESDTAVNQAIDFGNLSDDEANRIAKADFDDLWGDQHDYTAATALDPFPVAYDRQLVSTAEPGPPPNVVSAQGS